LRSRLAFLGFSSLVLFSSCSGLHYLVQAGRGQLALANRARPISEVIQDERVSPRIRKLLEEIPKIKKFGEKNGLKPTSNYTDYVQLPRPAAVYVVSACDPLEFRSKEWKFPIVGSFPYLGWFDLTEAKEFAHELKNQGYDVDLRGARAYSTLGWFRDSVLSSMIPDGDEALGELVNVVIHESVHATLYVKGQAYFDESLASFVADKLTYVYLDQTQGAGSPERKAYEKTDQDSEKVHERFHFLYEKLEAIYQNDKLSKDQKLTEKHGLISKIHDELKFKREINNATLVQFKEYNVGEAEFSTLYRSCNEELGRFLAALKHVTAANFAKPQQDDLGPVVLPLARDGCKS